MSVLVPRAQTRLQAMVIGLTPTAIMLGLILMDHFEASMIVLGLGYIQTFAMYRHLKKQGEAE